MLILCQHVELGVELKQRQNGDALLAAALTGIKAK